MNLSLETQLWILLALDFGLAIWVGWLLHALSEHKKALEKIAGFIKADTERLNRENADMLSKPPFAPAGSDKVQSGGQA